MKIVVGVDGSDCSKDALRWAVGEARSRDPKAEIVAVHAWGEGRAVMWDGVYLDGYDWEASARKVLDDAVDEVTRETGALIEKRLVDRHPAEALVRTAEDADLLVVGSRGYGGFRDLLLGSVGQHCVQHATCPVVVIPRHRRAA